MSDDEDTLSEAERGALRRWGGDWPVPAHLRDDTLHALRERRRFGPGPARGRRAAATLAWAAAAAALAFVAGLGVGGRGPATADLPPQRYMLLLYESDAYRAPIGESEQRQRVDEYVAWARGLSGEGRYVDGDELAPQGQRFGIEDGRLTPRPTSVDPEAGMLTGYFVVGAGSQGEAVALLRGCPHLVHGGTVEVRRIENH
jgi:hypothetical protein